MKPVFMAAGMVALSACFGVRLHEAAAAMRHRAELERALWTAASQELAQATAERQALTQRIREFKRRPGAKPEPSDTVALANAVLSNAVGPLSTAQRERILDELGFSWNTTGDFLVVSKEALRKVDLMSFTEGNRLTEILCHVLAITPAERARLEELMERMAVEYGAWAAAHYQRSPPHGEVLAQYTLPPAPELGQTLRDRFSAGVKTILEEERAGLLLGYASGWTSDLRMSGEGATTLTVYQPAAGQQWIPFEFKASEGRLIRTAITPFQPFPGPFRPLFPNGWRDLARREDFALPQEVQ